MKKVLVSVIALVGLAGCGAYYDYYKGGVRYTQDGRDCIYYSGEYGRDFSDRIDGIDESKKIVYRNTRCEDLYARDTFGMPEENKRQVLAPAAQPAKCQSCNTCNSCGNATPVLQRRYVIVAGM